MPPRKSPRRPRRKNLRKKRAVKTPSSTYKCVETVPTTQVALNTPYLQLKSGITGARAPTLARVFGLYRIAKITFTYRPLYDTYANGIAGTGNFATQVPTLYWKMNRYGDVPAVFDGSYMRAMGAKPIRLDDKNISFSYTPNVINTQANAVGSTPATIKMGPWLSTDDLVQDNAFTLSTAVHYGHSLFVEAAGAGSAQGPVANLDIKVVYEFKEPRLGSNPTSVSGQESSVVTLMV